MEVGQGRGWGDTNGACLLLARYLPSAQAPGGQGCLRRAPPPASHALSVCLEDTPRPCPGEERRQGLGTSFVKTHTPSFSAGHVWGHELKGQRQRQGTFPALVKHGCF